MNEVYVIHDGENVISTTMKPQTEGLFCVCDINELPLKKFVNGKLVDKTQAELNKEKLDNWLALRLSEYGSLDSQLDEIYHDINAWKSRIQAIKLKYPKP